MSESKENPPVLKAGMHVYIAHDLSETHKLYYVCPKMKRMRGSKQLIQYVLGNKITICGYAWSANDVITEEMKKRMNKIKFQEFYYDVNQLDT